MDTVTASNFQSVLQLAVALYVGFSALLTFIGTSLEKERKLIERAVHNATRYREASVSVRKDQIESRSTLSETYKLMSDFEIKVSSSIFLNSDIMRILSLVLALIAAALLILSSFFPTWTLTNWQGLAICLILLPIFVSIVYNAWFSFRVSKDFGKRRSDLHKKIVAGLVAVHS
jgi:hypothetical protein